MRTEFVEKTPTYMTRIAKCVKMPSTKKGGKLKLTLANSVASFTSKHAPATCYTYKAPKIFNLDK